MNRLAAFLVLAAIAALLVPTVARTAPTAPTGLTAIALDGKVGLAWKSVSGATSYKVFRGTSAASITTQVGTPTTTSYTDATVTNGTTYFYAVRASGVGDSSPSTAAQAKPVARTCSTGNAVVQENCFAGTTAWRATATGQVSAGQSNIEGFAADTSVNAGSSIDVKVNTGDAAPYRIDIYRMGYYGGTQSRLVGTLPGLSGTLQPSCQTGSGNTGLVDCSNWTTSASITTSSSWPSGVYMLRLVRTDNGSDNNVLFVVRNDASTSDVLFTVPTSTYQAYNNWGDKSLYDYNSYGDPTVSGAARAVKVSYDRPYANAQTYWPDPNWFGSNDVASAAFLERNGYDVTYNTSTDLHRSASLVANHKSFVSPTHDEYWSSEMRNGVKAARDAGTGLFWLGSNQVYWKIRYEASPFSGTANRVEVAYKSTQSGAVDPVGPTGTWRDPAGANAPENALVGQMYIGDNDASTFKLGVTAAEGKTRVWRHTEAATLAPNTTIQLGLKLLGWEWNDRVANGQEPAGLKTFASSAVTGQLVQHDGRDYLANASATSTGTHYRAASGAWVVSTGTNNWFRGLGLEGTGDGEPNEVIQQATINVLSDMRSLPTTPMTGMVVDAAGAPAVIDHTPSSGATGVPTGAAVTATFDKALDPSTVTAANVKLTTQAGSTVAASLSYDAATRTVTLNPTSALGANAPYTVTLKGGVGGLAAWGGDLPADVTWTFTTGAGAPPTVASVSPADGAGSVSVGTTVRATFDRDMTASTITSSSFTLTPQVGNAVAATVTYDAATDTAILTPSAALDPSRQYTATLTTAVKGADGTSLAQAKSWTFTTVDALTVTDRVPAPLSTGVSPGAVVRATFSRAVDATTLTAANVTLKQTSSGTSATVGIAYDATTRTVTLTPSAALAVSTQYTVNLAAAIKAADGATLGADVTWTFTTAASTPAAPTVVATSPSTAATGVPADSTVTATFDRAMDAATITGQSFVLRDPSNATVASTVTYDAASQTARLAPVSALSPGVVYTAQLTTANRSAAGTAMANAVSWTFTTADCPCSLLTTATPAYLGLDVADGRSGTGNTYEMGMKFTVDKTMRFTGVRFYKDAGETGTHIGRLWSAAGVSLGTVTFANETASGWQRATFGTPVNLTAGTVYVVSVGFNSRFVMTSSGLANQLNYGPLHSVADGANGVFGNAAGTFPNQSWSSSNYFVDPVVGNVGAAANVPQVTSRTPVASATNVATTSTVTATFGSAMDASSITGTTFSLATSGGTAVPATVTYDSATRTATLTPSSSLTASASYTAKLTTGIRSDDGTALPAQSTWSFSTVAAGPAAPAVTSTSPAAGATGVVNTQPVQATFSASMDPSTITASTFTLTAPGGATVPAAVTYDDPTQTATLTPTGPLTKGVVYTATVTTGAKSSGGTALAATKTWTFTTSSCPCSLMSSLTPAATGLDVRDGRWQGGPWTYEMGTKVSVSSAASLTAIRFYKDAAETGTHVGTLWSSAGTAIAQVTFTGETASGWQQMALASPVALTPGVTYTVSVGFNSRFTMTSGGLSAPLSNGPLSAVNDGQNGVFASAAGLFPSSSWGSSNYFVDAVVQ
jgi:hypothetical protein